MSIRHAAALAAVGWYLMYPPTQRDLDGSCNFQRAWNNSITDPTTGEDLKPIWADYVSVVLSRLRGEKNLDVNKVAERRCDTEGTKVAHDAPLSRWIQLGSFERLADCEDRYNAGLSQEEGTDIEGLAATFSDVWGEGVAAHDIALGTLTATRSQTNAATCVAADDPRLKGK